MTWKRSRNQKKNINVQIEHCPDTLDEVVEDDEYKSIHLKGIVVE